MNQRGRKSAASLAVVGAEVTGITRLGPPGTLSEAERAIWVRTVNARPADWFGEEHLPLLVNYCRHVVAADIINQQIAAFEPEWLKEEAGLERYERLRKLLREETRALQTLARSMRITQQSLYRADAAAVAVEHKAGRKPWEKA